MRFVSDLLASRAPQSTTERVYVADGHRLCRWYGQTYRDELTPAGLTLDVIERYRLACLTLHRHSTWLRKRAALRWLLRELAPRGADIWLVGRVRA